ncbi:MAG: flavin reductase family protein [Actinomycetes bacterium]
MSIHSAHPFVPPEGERAPLRRLRGRLPLPVTVWTTALRGRRAGWTVSSLLLADGEPPQVLGLVDEDSDLADLLPESGTVAVSLLDWSHRALAEVFAGLAPAPGGPFRTAAWTATAWGPVLDGAPGWVGARIEPGTDRAGWSLLVRGRIEHIEVPSVPTGEALGYLRGRYRALPWEV